MSDGGILQEDVRELTGEEYNLFRRLVYAKSGINLGECKQQLVRARLGKRLRAGKFRSYRAYYEFIESDASGRELGELLDAISTNTTHLFREMRHFTLLGKLAREWATDAGWKRRYGSMRIWSAACSSGEEPHSIAMTVHDALRGTGVQARILATDLSGRVLAKAKMGVYEPHKTGTVPAELRSRYLRRTDSEGRPALEITPDIREMITFSRFNLMSPRFPFRHGFDVVFCRNVMIYFDRATQQALVNKIAAHLRPGGRLIIGHSESLSGVEHPLEYAEPTVYVKK